MATAGSDPAEVRAGMIDRGSVEAGMQEKRYLRSVGVGPLIGLGALLLLVGTFSFGIELAGAAPTHPFLESFNGAGTPAGGIDQACGIAVDGEGDLYVADHGHDAIDVFDPTGAFLTSIAAAAPCDLAVDSEGSVYAVTAGNVVKYEPNGGSYPPTAATTYGAPVTFDSSGEATTVAVNPADDRVYVASPSVVTVYNSDGSLNQVNEVQRLAISCTGGSYRLSFEGQQTGPLPCDAPGTDPGTPGVVDSIQEALEALSTIGAGNVSVSGAFPTLVTFTGALGNADVPPLVADASGLTGGLARVVVAEAVKGFGGHIGEGVLSKAFGVDVWGANGYVYVSEEGGRVYVFDAKGSHLRAEIDGSVAADGAGSPGAFGTLPQANVAVDQANGHVFVSDVKESGTVFEFEASGPYVSQMSNGFEDAGPTDLAVDPSEGAGHGRVYVSSGSGPGSRIDVFGPLPIPSHPALPALPKAFNNACGVAVGSDGRVYVTSEGSSSIDVFAPAGKSWNLVATISDTARPCGVAVDAAGNVYVTHPNANAAEQTLLMYPPVTSTTYGLPKVIDPATTQFASVAVNPVNQHVLVSHGEVVFEYDSAANNSALLRDNLGQGLGLSEISAVGVYGKSGYLYVTNRADEFQGATGRAGIVVFDPVANELVAVINGSDAVSRKPDGGISTSAGSIAVDQTDGHVFYSPEGPAADVYEFEASGAYVSRFGRSTENGGLAGVAVDNSGGPNDRDVFVAGGLNGPSAVDVYEAAVYGEPPAVVTGAVSGADGAEATLSGTVDPRGFPLQDCRFEYVDDAGFEAGGFAGAASQACAESLASIGSGSAPATVHADVSGLSPGRYHYRLRAANKYGAALGPARVFGPVVVTTKAASPVLVTEATLRAAVDPDGLVAGYHFEYGESDTYEHSTPAGEIAATEGPVDISAAIFGLTPGVTYHFRIVASNSLGTFIGPDQTLTTSVRPVAETCPNASLRSGASAGLLDCRAYELVTPALNGLKPASQIGTNAETSSFDTWLGAPGGDSLIFDTSGSLPGVAGNGVHDQYRAVRGDAGWSIALVAPSGAEAEEPRPGGVSSDHSYAFWLVERGAHGAGSLEAGAPRTTYVRNPDGSFAVLGRGSLGEDPLATGRWISAGGTHIVFTTASGSAVQLEPKAPAPGLAAIYDRTPDGVTHVVSLLPGDQTPTTDSEYRGVSADGSAVFFAVGGVLYERRDDATTLQVSPAGATFAGASENGGRVFYLRGGDVFAFDADAGATTKLTSAGGATVVNASADGSHLYFVSPEQLDGANGVAGSNNLYVWDGASIHFIAVLSADDLRDPGAAVGETTLAGWTDAVGPKPDAFTGPGFDPSRTTPDGTVFVFQSFANLTSYDSEGHSEIFRFDTADGSLLCVSCDPGGDPPSGEAELQQVNEGLNHTQHQLGISPVNALSHIANLTSDGNAVFFQTADSLLPADGDGYADVYEWRLGRLSLISWGGSSNHDYFYGMSADGRDVFFETNDSLLPQDQDGGDPSIYDARVDGGFAAPGAQPCLEDSCQGTPAGAPVLPAPTSSAVRGPGNPPAGHARRCPRGKRAVRRHGHVRCVKKKRHHKAAAHKRHPQSTQGHHGGGR
jgi:streptogramin lyase